METIELGGKNFIHTYDAKYKVHNFTGARGAEYFASEFAGTEGEFFLTSFKSEVRNKSQQLVTFRFEGSDIIETTR